MCISYLEKRRNLWITTSTHHVRRSIHPKISDPKSLRFGSPSGPVPRVVVSCAIGDDLDVSRLSGLHEIIRQLPSLGLVVPTSAGVNHIDVSECRRRGIVIADSRESLSKDVADMGVGLLIDVSRKISAADRYLRKGNWAAFGYFPLLNKLIIVAHQPAAIGTVKRQPQ
ncbi:D-isomer specific 2-hydroxyacid dehydrogenase, catalytic domain containing protein [Parasponia andersonii]|uniref:D-isomer specific 2-hydroxyacid dehydrogenase, catalytic domain containing protein n=1 Tax=Parasponia andersonii TaxID=3476 RepID=A0A2P5ALR1_PARAD|nr:D-isomer specific 2-hydroxyacid dehydrogenase, catalytic domain containing protein [Parasponia andersonii]